MALRKKLLKHPAVQASAAWLLALYIRFVFLTSRIVRRIEPGAEPYVRGDDNGIFAFWHGRMMLLPVFCLPIHRMHVLISLHRDGMLISRVIRHFGHDTVAGSSSRGGTGAARAILDILRAGDNIAITPDGPRGPAQVASIGIASVSRMSQKPVLPVTFSASRCVRLRSWDRFMVVLPFGTIVFCVGAPILLAQEEDERSRLVIEQAMNALNEMADGQTHV
jgi:lysophospholipid acyltransferase (LPLAT)-like uncharacterized protein